MLRLIYVVIMNLFRAPYIIPKMRRETEHPETYSMGERYSLARHMIRLMKVSGKIHTRAFGTENLPPEGGYIMYPNHQGKYDALGIIYTHKAPCSLVMDKAKSEQFLVKEFVDLLGGKRLERDNVRQALTVINEVAEDVKQGKRYILFPEGGYGAHSGNRVEAFKAGSFKSALKAKAPIVPVALLDSYKVFNSIGFHPVTTQVRYLKPIYYEEYAGMRTNEIALLVQGRIQQEVNAALRQQEADA